jgi:hypothetical protein
MKGGEERTISGVGGDVMLAAACPSLAWVFVKAFIGASNTNIHYVRTSQGAAT